jgi:hypothetical protein
MKARKLGKRLVFKKETIMNLSNQEMKVAQGAAGQTGYYWCYSNPGSPCTLPGCTVDPTCPCTFGPACTPTDPNYTKVLITCYQNTE